MMTVEKAVDRVIDRCNLIGTDCDVYAVMFQYKAIRELPEAEQDEIYNDVVKSLGFTW